MKELSFPSAASDVGVLDHLKQFLKDEAEIGGVSTDANGLIKIEWKSKTGAEYPWLRTVFLDPNKGFAPVKFDAFVNITNEKGEEIVDHDTASTSQWSKFGDVWVPTACEIGAPDTPSKVVLELQWISVNRPVDPSTFKVEGF